MDRRQELETWIASTRRNQRFFAIALVPLAVLAIALGPLAFLFVSMIGVTGLWVMYAHNEAHRTPTSSPVCAEVAISYRPGRNCPNLGHTSTAPRAIRVPFCGSL